MPRHGHAGLPLNDRAKPNGRENQSRREHRRKGIVPLPLRLLSGSSRMLVFSHSTLNGG
jgi:hypothetical protein